MARIHVLSLEKIRLALGDISCFIRWDHHHQTFRLMKRFDDGLLMTLGACRYDVLRRLGSAVEKRPGSAWMCSDYYAAVVGY